MRRAWLLLWPFFQLGAQETIPQDYTALCAACHGETAGGTERGSSLVDNRRLRTRSVLQIRDVIRNGTQGGMPPFNLPDEKLLALATWVHSLNASAYDAKPPGDAAAGEQFLFGKGQCASCHMIAGRGGTNGPDLSSVGRQLTLRQLEQALVDPVARTANRSAPACPGWAWCPDQTWTVVNVHLRNGSVLRGFAKNQGRHD